jgi:hypothetical protein
MEATQAGPAAPAAAGAAPSLTFAWLGDPSPDAGGLLLYYQSFQFCATTYAVGDHVYLTPEDKGAPLYLARITAAFEDTQQQSSDRLCVEVRRRPATGMRLSEATGPLLLSWPSGCSLVLIR